MALVLQDRVKETSTTTGSGTITLSGTAYDGYRTFASCVPTGSIVYYCIHNTDPSYLTEWEVGYGTYTLSGNTLSRTSVYSSSNSNSLVTFSSGTKEVFITYPSEQAVYQETNGNLRIINGVIEVSVDGTSGTTLPNATFQAFATIDGYIQNNIQNLSSGSNVSADFVATNDAGDDTKFYVDMGINGSNFTSASYPLYTPNSGYIYAVGDAGSNNSTLFVGSGDGDVVFHAGGWTSGDVVATAAASDKSMTFAADVGVGGALDVTGAATFSNTVTLSANPTTALQAATKAYVDNQVTAGLHIHDPVLVETTGNLTATYAQGGTTFNITDITSTTTVTTSASHGLSVNDQIWLYSTAGNGLSTNTAYFVYSTPAANQLTLSLTFGGAQITGLTNASGLSYATRANSGVGATLTNSGAQAALTIDGVAMTVADRVMVRLQTNGYENGVYVVTTVGNGSTNWVLTRSTDCNKVEPSDPNGVGTGDYFYTQSGTLNAGDSHVLTTEPNTMIIGYTTLTYTQFSGSVDYTGGTNINVTGQVISLTGTVAATNGGTGANTVTTGDLLYGSATDTWSKLPAGAAYKSLVMNAGGTNVEWNAVALNQTGAVSGSLGPTNGGTGQATYTTGDTLYASATNTLSKLSGNTTTTKKYLQQQGDGANSAAPSWEQINLSDTTGTLGVANGGTGATTLNSNAVIIGNGTSAVQFVAPGTANNVLTSNGTAWVSQAGGGGGSGTVTSITAGTGLNGGTITTSGTISLANTSVTAGSYTTANITVDAQGRITAASNGASGSQGLVRAWVQINSTAGGLTVNASYNHSSLADNGVGDYTSNFSTAMPDNYYGSAGFSKYVNGNALRAALVSGSGTLFSANSTSMRWASCNSNSGAAVDYTWTSINFFY